MLKNLVFFTQFTYIPLLILTPISLTGYFTDLFALILTGFFSIKWFVLRKVNLFKLISSIIYSCIILLWFISIILNPYSWNQFKVKSLISNTDSTNITFTYFKPVGAWGCGYGSTWETKVFKYFPIIEVQTEYTPCVHDNYGYYIETGSWE